jgi:hypothetical protein
MPAERASIGDVPVPSRPAEPVYSPHRASRRAVDSAHSTDAARAADAAHAVDAAGAADLLFEIGCEEIPAKMLARALAELPALVEALAVAAHAEEITHAG